MITIATHAARRCSDTSEISAATISSLSASGSISLPNVVIESARAREVAVDEVRQRRQREHDRREHVARGVLPSSATTSTGTSMIRSTVSRLGRFSGNIDRRHYVLLAHGGATATRAAIWHRMRPYGRGVTRQRKGAAP